MELFDYPVDGLKNLLPKDGLVNYHGKVFSDQESNQFLEGLLRTIDWKNDQAIIFGKLIVTKRKVAWYGDLDFTYTYSKLTKVALPWTKELMALKVRVEEIVGERFNSCLLNLYHTGEEGMAWHSDDEKDLKTNGTIGSLSFGAKRKFSFKHKITQEVVSLFLEHGSLLVMKEATQIHWLHRLPPTKIILTPRINLTFRTIDR